MELSVAPSSAHCAATTISSSFSKWCPFPVSVSHTEQMLEVVTLLRGGPLRVRPAELRNPTLFLRKALCGHVLLALQIHAPGSDRMASSSCGAPSILFTAFQRLALSFRATARWSRDFSGCPYWRTRRRTSLAACAIRNAGTSQATFMRGSSAQPRGVYVENEKHNVTTIHVHSKCHWSCHLEKRSCYRICNAEGSYSQYTKTKPTENEAATRTERPKLGTHPNLPRARGDRHPLETCTRLTLGSALSDVPVEDGMWFSLSGGSQNS